MIPLLLALLVVTDTAFSGFRDAAGRDLRIYKRNYYLRACARGSIYGLLLVLAFSMLVASFCLHAKWPALLWLDFTCVALSMVQIYGVFATIVLATLVLYMFSSGDLRTLTTVIILGPFTLVRPVVIAAGTLSGISHAMYMESIFVAIMAAAVMIIFERMLGYIRHKPN